MRHAWVLAVLCTFLTSVFGESALQDGKTCTVRASGNNITDDAPAILGAFRECGHRGKVVFLPTTYYVNSVMNITWLEDVAIDVQGTLLVCDP